MNHPERSLIAGIGSDFGDDRLGFVVAGRLANRLPAHDVRRLRSPLDLLDCPTDVAQWHIVDACRGAGPPGTLVRRDFPTDSLEKVHFSGTHDIGLLAAIQLTEQLQGLPPRVTVWCVEASDELGATSVLAELSSSVASAVAALVERIAAEVAGDGNGIEGGE